tara:strand:- start:9325 stop:9996 length:672 start_codon:yes stop_codon:yes gene_type:complete
MNYSTLTLLIPAKEDTDCLFQVLKELEKYDIKKIIVIPKNTTLPNNVNFDKIKIINQSKNGYGNALIEGINKIDTEFFCIFNADGSFVPAELDKMLELTKQFDFIFASRYLKNAKSDDDTVITFLGNYFFSTIGKIFFNVRLSDILYTFVLCNTKKTKLLNLISEDFGFCIELPIKIERKKFKYIDIASHERNRISGKKNVREFVDGFKILIKMIKLFFYKKI